MIGVYMWKIAIGFVIFAGVALWILSKGGDIDIGGEKHEIHVPTPVPSPAASGPAPAAIAKPASAP